MKINEKLVKVKLLLENWGLHELKPRFTRITIDTFETITENDLYLLFPRIEDLNLKCVFRENLIKWRQSRGYVINSPTLNDTVVEIIEEKRLQSESDSLTERLTPEIWSADEM